MDFFKEFQSREEKMLEEIDKPGSDIEKYIQSMEKILEEKKEAINYLQEKIICFKGKLKEEQILSEKARIYYD